MKASDLRIGNYVTANGVISEINYITPVTLGYGEKEFAPICTSNYEYFQPIPITEEWLDKCPELQLRKDGSDSMYFRINDVTLLEIIIMKDGCYPQLWQAGELSHQDDNMIVLERIKYIHELQNLYKELKKKELEFKL